MAGRMPARTQCEKSPQRQPSFSDNDVEFKETSCLAVGVGSPFGGLQVPVVIGILGGFPAAPLSLKLHTTQETTVVTEDALHHSPDPF